MRKGTGIRRKATSIRRKGTDIRRKGTGIRRKLCSNIIFLHHKSQSLLQCKEGSEDLMLPDFVTTAQYGGRLSGLRTGRLYP
jgi:hypothetical protein